MKHVFFLVTIFIEFINSATWAKNFLRSFQSREHRVLDFEVEQVQTTAKFYQKETDKYLKDMVATLTECQQHQEELEGLIGNEELSKYQSENKHDCEDPRKIIENFRANNDFNLAQPKKFTQRVPLSIEQMEQEYTEGVKLRDSRMAEFALARQKDNELKSSTSAFCNQVGEKQLALVKSLQADNQSQSQ
jgi:hypothetical protein